MRVLKYGDWMKIKLVLTDIDGCMTDNCVFYTPSGDKVKKFNMADGMGVKILQNEGLSVGVISGDNSMASKKRMEDLKVNYIYINVKEKDKILDELIRNLNIKLDEVAYMGDDLQDLCVLKKVGLSFCPNNAVSEVKECVNVVLNKSGGDGAFREYADYVLDYNRKIERKNLVWK